MNTGRVFRSVPFILLVFSLLQFMVPLDILFIGKVSTSTCNTSGPTSNSYTFTVCFTNPGKDSSLTGNITVAATGTMSSSITGIQRMVFYLDGTYLLTDYQSPYTFTLPTTNWVDGSYTLSVEALLRDGFTSQRANLSVNFKNGVTTPPVNTGQFQPTSGTTPAPGAPFVMVAAGDGASGENNSEKVTKLISSINPNLLLYLGDVYEKGSPTEFYNWYGTGQDYFSLFRAITDPTVGNHEYTSDPSAKGYFNYWDNIPNYYSFDADGWHFVSLNSNVSYIGVNGKSSQYQWLAKDLDDHANACTIVFYHQPLFNIGPEGETTQMAEVWALMAQDGVSIVLNGHDHDYQRWVPLDAGGQPSPTGITEFVAGGAGHGLQTFNKTDSRVAYSNDTNPQAFGVLKFILHPTGVDFSYINSSKTVLDSGSIPCAKAGGAPQEQIPGSPVGLTAMPAGETKVNLSWQTGANQAAASGYTIYRDGKVLDTVSGETLTYTDTTVKSGSTHSYTVDAFDTTGSHSPQTSQVSVTTPVVGIPSTGSTATSSATKPAGEITPTSVRPPTATMAPTKTFTPDLSDSLLNASASGLIAAGGLIIIILIAIFMIARRHS